MKEYTVKVYKDRTEWYFSNKLHRENGPAVEYVDGAKWWYKNGKPHREDGPAWESNTGEKNWYLGGKKLTEKEINKVKPKNTSTCDGKYVKVDGIKYKLVKI